MSIGKEKEIQALDRGCQFAVAWMIMVFAVALHVTDEALTGFLSIYNPTVVELHQRVSWLPAPTFTNNFWLSALIASLCIAFFLTPIAFHYPRVFRPFAMICAIFMIMNGCSHLIGSALGHTFADIRFSRPMPGTYSSPTMIAAAIYLIVGARRCVRGG